MDIQLELNIKEKCMTDNQILDKYHDFIFKSVDHYYIMTRKEINGILGFYRECTNCHERLKSNHCDKCDITYTKDEYFYVHSEDGSIIKKKAIFDVEGLDLYIYYLTINYDPDSVLKLSLKDKNKNSISHIDIDKYYLIPEGLVDVETGKLYDFKTYKEANKYCTSFGLNDKYKKLREKVDETYKFLGSLDELYLDNIDEVCNYHLLKHCCLKEIIEYIQSDKINLSLNDTIINSLCYPEREYLIKMGLMNLAVYSCDEINFKKTIKDTLGIDKSYIPYIKEKDLDYTMLLGLIKYPIKDPIINYFVGMVIESNEDLDKFRDVGIKKVAYYCWDKNYYDYFDYVRMAEDMGMNLSDKRVMLPKSFKEAHDALVDQYMEINDKKTLNAIKKYGKKCLINKYEDNKYIIIPADSYDSLKDESKQMNNCVRTYAEKIAEGKCQIYFMRKKETPNKSFVTIEVRGITVVQARSKNNKDVSATLMKVIKKFESKLEPIE